MDLQSLLLEFCRAQIFTPGFLGGIVGNIIAGAGYDLGKSGLNQLGHRISEIWRQGGNFKNHDLLRAILIAECQAMVAVCDICLLEDYQVEPTLLQAIFKGNEALPHLTNSEVRSIAELRTDYRGLSAKVVKLSEVEMESHLSTTLNDVDELIRAGGEIQKIDDRDKLRRRTTEAARALLNRKYKPDNLSQIKGYLERKLFGKPQDYTIPQKLLNRFDNHWFDFLRQAFREVMKSDEYAKSRRAFELDVLGRLAEGIPREFSPIEVKLDRADKNLDLFNRELVEIREILESLRGDTDERLKKHRKLLEKALDDHQMTILDRLDRLPDDVINRLKEEFPDIEKRLTEKSIDREVYIVVFQQINKDSPFNFPDPGDAWSAYHLIHNEFGDKSGDAFVRGILSHPKISDDENKVLDRSGSTDITNLIEEKHHLLLLIEEDIEKQGAYTLSSWLWDVQQKPKEVKSAILNLRSEDLAFNVFEIIRKAEQLASHVTGIDLICPPELFADVASWRDEVGISLMRSFPVSFRWDKRVNDLRHYHSQEEVDLGAIASYWLKKSRAISKVPEIRIISDFRKNTQFQLIDNQPLIKLKNNYAVEEDFGVCTGFKILSVTNQKKEDGIFQELLKVGMPIAIWFNDDGKESCLTEKDFFNLIKKCPLSKLPEKVFERRKLAFDEGGAENNSDCHLMLIYDDSERLPPPLELNGPAEAHQK